MFRRRGTPSNAHTETVTVFVGDPIAERLVGALRAHDVTALDPRFSRSIVWGVQGSRPVTFSGDAGPLQHFTRVPLASNPNLIGGDNQALPGTNPPAGAYSTARDALRRLPQGRR